MHKFSNSFISTITAHDYVEPTDGKYRGPQVGGQISDGGVNLKFERLVNYV